MIVCQCCVPNLFLLHTNGPKISYCRFKNRSQIYSLNLKQLRTDTYFNWTTLQLILKLISNHCLHLKHKKAHIVLSVARGSNLNVCQKLFFLVHSFSIFSFLRTPCPTWNHFKKENISSYMSKNRNSHEECMAGGWRTIHLLGDGRWWRAAVGSHFPSITTVGMLVSMILRRAWENTQMESVMCFRHGAW